MLSAPVGPAPAGFDVVRWPMSALLGRAVPGRRVAGAERLRSARLPNGAGPGIGKEEGGKAPRRRPCPIRPTP